MDNSRMIRAVSNLSKLSAQLALSDYRLTTGKRVNTASDDPTGIIAATRFSAEIAKIDAKTTNGERINSMIDAADGALAEISTLMDTIEADILAASSDTATAAEKAAYQAEIDDAIDAINRLSDTTSFNGTKLLNGDIGYTTTGIDTNKLASVRVNSIYNAGTSATINISASLAQEAMISFRGANPASSVTFNLTGSDGTAQITWADGMNKSTLANLINTFTDQTGVSANYTAELVMELTSVGTGADEFVTIDFVAGTITMDDGDTSDYGEDAAVGVNGTVATVDDQEVYYSSGNTNIHFTLTDSFNTTGGTTSFTVTGNGAGWSLDATSNGRIDFGTRALKSTTLGNSNIGYLNTLKSGGTNDIDSENFTEAAAIASLASDQVSFERARFGALQSITIDSTLNAIADVKTSLTAAESDIMDLDYVEESANNARLEILVEVAAQVVGAMNTNASSVLSLLGLGYSG